MSATSLQSETIVSMLSNKLGGRLSHNEDSYVKIGTDRVTLDIIRRGYKPTWDKKFPRQRIVAHNPTILAKASQVFNIEVEGLAKNGIIHKVGHLIRQYVNSYFVVAKFKRFLDN